MWCTRLAENTGRKNSPKSPSWHHRTTLSGYIFAIKARIDNWKKPSQYGELRPINGRDQLAGLGHPSIFQRGLRLGFVTARHSSSGRQPNCAALNRGRHLYLAGRPSRWALAHISSSDWFCYYNQYKLVCREDEHNLIAQYCQCLHGCNSKQSVSPDCPLDKLCELSRRVLH